MTTPHPVMIFGCGYLGLRVARAYLAQGRQVFALTRGRADELTQHGIKPFVGDVLDPVSLSPLAALPAETFVVYCVGYDRRASASQRDVYVKGVENVCRALPQHAHWVHVSSTGVYGQTDGSWVDESSPTEPLEASGKIVLDAEHTLLQHKPTATRLRFAGIYGPGRVLRRDALLRGDPLTIDSDKYLNLIHVDDGVRAILACETNAAVRGEALNICDDTPSTRREIYTETARLLDAPPAQFVAPEVATIETDRRVSNAKAKKLLGAFVDYPSYREGLAASLS